MPSAKLRSPTPASPPSGAFCRGRHRRPKQLRKLKARAAALPGSASDEIGFLLDAHLAMLANSRLVRGVHQRIASAQINAERAVELEIEAIAKGFAAMRDAYLAARVDDIRVVGVAPDPQPDRQALCRLRVAERRRNRPRRGSDAGRHRADGPAPHRRVRVRVRRPREPYRDHGPLARPAGGAGGTRADRARVPEPRRHRDRRRRRGAASSSIQRRTTLAAYRAARRMLARERRSPDAAAPVAGDDPRRRRNRASTPISSCRASSTRR